jgi:hypothetical protein
VIGDMSSVGEPYAANRLLGKPRHEL